MALDREQVGLLFKLQADTTDARQQMEVMQSFVEGVTEAITEDFKKQSAVVRQTTRDVETFGSRLGGNVRDQVSAFASRFGALGETLGDSLPALSGTTAAMVGIGGAAIAAAAGIAKLSLATAEYAGNIADLSAKTNLTTDTLQSLRLAATLSGQSFESISQTAVIFQRRIEEARQGNEQLAETFRALGIDLQGPVDTAFRQTLERLSQAEDGAAKTALTVDLFGRSGSDLLPIMAQLGGQFSNLENRARELGIVLDQEAIKKADEFGDQIDILKLQLGAVANDIGSFFIPAFLNYVQVIGVVSQAFRDLATGAESAMSRVQRAVIAALALTNPATAQFAGLIATGGGQRGGFQGPGINEESGLPTFTPPTPGRGARGGGGRGAVARPETVRLPIEDFDRLTQQYFDRLNKLEEESLDRLETAREKSATARERTLQEIEDAEIAAIQARIDAAEIAEEAGAARIAAVRVAAFARTEDQLKALLDRQTAEAETARAEAEANRFNITSGRLLQAKADALDAEQQLTVDKLTQLEEERRRITEEGNRQIELGRQRDLENLLRNADEQKRIYQEIEAARRQFLGVDSLAAGIFGTTFSEALRRTGSELAAFQAVMANFVSQTRQALSELPSLADTAFGAMTEGAIAMAEAFALTGQTGPAAMRQLAAGVLGAIAKMAAQKAILNLALGIENLALAIMGVPNAGAAAAKHFIAAGIYGAIAAATGAAARAVAPAGAGGGTTGGGGTGTSDRDRRIIEQGGPLRGNQQPQVIIIRAETEPGVVVRKVVEDYRSNGPSRQVLRRDMLGEG